MSKKSIFDLDPEQLNQLLSIGKEPIDPLPQEPSSSADVDQAARTASLNVFIEKPGDKIGRYKLLSILGEGGMGIVYLAEQQEPIRRKVALKVIKPGMDSKRVMARFEAERQALALLDHPNIAHVYDAETTEAGRPYFVMEYVKGRLLTEHCDQHKLTIEDRLRLFQLVCQAVQHAHQKGIIHRDIKPSNILVSMEEDRAIPKIIDFGIAKALAQSLTERTLATEDSQLLGTPEYMSPEQADPTSADVDTRSDVYSLGVLLYVLLTGALPFDSDTLRTGGIERIRQIIRESNPKTPSTRLTGLGEEAKKVAENRRTEIAALAKHLRKELEWIPLKAMRKERADRYRSASELADDIENYLNGVPLIAGPLGIDYKLKKFVRRNRMLVGGIAAVLTVLIAGVVVSTIFAFGQARALADNQRIIDFLENDVLGSADKARVDEATVSYVLDSASKNLDVKFKDKPLIRARLYQKLGETYWRLGEYEKATQHLSRAIEIYRRHCGEAHANTLKAMDAIGWVYVKQGRYYDMELLWGKILDIRQRVHGEEYPIGTMHGLAVSYYFLGKYKQAELLFDEMLQQDLDEIGLAGYYLPHIKLNLAIVYTLQGRYEKAEPLFIETLANTEWAGESTYPADLANMYRKQGRYEKAEPLLEKVLETQRQMRGNEDFHTVCCMDYLAQLYADQDRHDDAEKLFSEALSIGHRRMRPEHPVILSLVNARAGLYKKQKQYDQAERLFDEALKGRQRELGEDHPETLETKNDLAMLYLEQARNEEAEPLLLEALKGRRLKLGDTHPHTLESWNNLIDLYEAWGNPEEANEWRTKLPAERSRKDH